MQHLEQNDEFTLAQVLLKLANNTCPSQLILAHWDGP